MSSFGVARDVIIKSIMEKQHNCISTTYYCLLQKIKNEGGTSSRPSSTSAGTSGAASSISSSRTASSAGKKVPPQTSNKVAGVSDLQATLTRRPTQASSQ
jgi:hypothetical protein